MTTKDTLTTLLADYAAPADDQGFSNAVLAALHAQERADTVDLTRFAARPAPIWRSWLIALIIGGVFGLMWARFSANLPELPAADAALLGGLMTGWTAYGLAALGLMACLLLIETEVF